MNGVTYVKSHKGPNPLFSNLTDVGGTRALPGHDVNGADLGSIFNVECNVVKGDVTTKSNITFFVTPDELNPDGTVRTHGKTYIRVHDGSDTKLVEVDSVTYEEVDTHRVVDSTTTPDTLDVKKTIAVVHGADGQDYPLPVEVIHNGDAVQAIETLTNRNLTPPNERKPLSEMQEESKVVVHSQLPNPDETVLTGGISTANPTIAALSAKSPIATYSRIRSGDPRINRFPTSKYPDRAAVDEMGIEYYVTFQHTRAAAAGGSPTVVEDRVAVTIDHNGKPVVAMDFGSGEQYYTLEGIGRAHPPVREGETPVTEHEVIYFDVINNRGQKQRIYLPAEYIEDKDHPENQRNIATYKFFQDLLQGKVDLHNLDEVSVIPEVKQLSDKLMNQVFDEDRIPTGPLSYRKDDVTYYYVPHDNGPRKDYLRLMQKDGSSRLYINLTDVVRDPSATPPADKFPENSTFEVMEFTFVGTAPNEHLAAMVSDGDKVRQVELPITRAEAEASCLCDPNPPHALYLPSEVVSRNTFTAVTDTNYPNCNNKTATSTVQQRTLTGNFHYEYDSNKYHYISFMDGAVEKHLQVIQRVDTSVSPNRTRLYANFNTNPSDPNQSETCLIESIEPGPPCTATYITGNPAKRYNGPLPAAFNDPSNAAAVTDLIELAQGNDPARATYPIQSHEVPPVEHADMTVHTEVVGMKNDGKLKTNGNRKVGEVSLINETDDFLGMTGVKAFSQSILLPDGSKQTLSTFHSDTTLLTVSENKTLIATFNVRGTSGLFPAPPDPNAPNSEMVMSEAKARELGLYSDTPPSYGTPDGSGNIVFPIDAIQLSQNGEVKDIVIKAGGPNVRISFSSQGIVASTPSGVVRQPAENPPLDIGLSDKFYNNAINIDGGSLRPIDGCTLARDAKGNIVNKDLNGAILESLVRQQREAVKNGADPIENPMELADGSKLYSIPVRVKGSTEPVYLDYMVAADGTVYQYQHRTKESTKGSKGSDFKPGWQRVEQVVFRTDSAGNKYLATTLGNDSRAATPVRVTSVGTSNPTLGVPLDSFENNEILMDFFTGGIQRKLGRNPQLKTPTEGVTTTDVVGTATGTHYPIPVDTDNSDFGAVLSGDDGLAQLERELTDEDPLPVVDAINDPSKVPLDNVSAIADPAQREVGSTKDQIEKDVAPEKAKRKLWNGIKDENRKLWIAAGAVLVALSVFLPFLGIIAGIILGIAAASDTKIFDDLYLSPKRYYQRHNDKAGRGIERTMNKNKDAILKFNNAISVVDQKIARVQEDTSLTPAQKAAKLAKLNAERNSYISSRDNLIHENERLSIDLAVHSDKQLIDLKKEQADAQNKVTRVDSLLTAHGLTDMPQTEAERNAQLVVYHNLLNNRAYNGELRGIRPIVEQQMLYILGEQVYQSTPPRTGPALTADQLEEKRKLEKKFDFQQEEFDQMKELQERKDAGELSNEDLERLELLKKKYGISPFASLREWFRGTSESVERRTEEVTAMAERYVEEHPENGWRDFKFEDETNRPICTETETRADWDPKRRNNVGKKGAYSRDEKDGRDMG